MTDPDPRQLARFDFLQLVRRLLRPDAPGQEGPAPDEVLRFRADLSARFPVRNASTIELMDPAWRPGPWNLVPPGDEGLLPPQRQLVCITTPDFCLGSVLGPLPEPFLEWVRELERAGRPAMRDFLDLFNHRLNVLRYQARAQFEPGLDNDVPENTLRAQWLAALMGVGSEAAASQIPLRKRNWLGIGSLLANSRRSAAGAVRVLAAHLRCGVRLVPLVPAWRPLGPAGQHVLGQRRLGQDGLLGYHAWDPQAAVRLEIGPLPYAGLVRLLPPLAAPQADAPDPTARELQLQYRQQQSALLRGEDVASGHTQLAALVHLMLNRRHDAHIELRMAGEEIPSSVLTSAPPATSAGLRLGLTAWLKSRPPRRRRQRRWAKVRFSIPAFAAAEVQP